MTLLQDLTKQKKISPPTFVLGSTNYMTIMGSVSYGVSNDSSDVDLYGFCTPPKEIVFPHTNGIIPGFGRQEQRFEQWQEHHVIDDSKNKEYDFQIFNIVKYFQLLMENNPNIIDSIFTPDNCILKMDKVGNHIRSNRDLFLHKGAIYKFRGYASSQFSKIKNKTNSSNPKRKDSIEKFGFDVKFSYHLCRLLLEAEQIANEHTLDIQRNRELLKSIRRGEWTFDFLQEWYDKKLIQLEECFSRSTLRNVPDEQAIKQILIECLEMSYGSIDGLIKVEKETKNESILKDLKELVKKYS